MPGSGCLLQSSSLSNVTGLPGRPTSGSKRDFPRAGDLLHGGVRLRSRQFLAARSARAGRAVTGCEPRLPEHHEQRAAADRIAAAASCNRLASRRPSPAPMRPVSGHQSSGCLPLTRKVQRASTSRRLRVGDEVDVGLADALVDVARWQAVRLEIRRHAHLRQHATGDGDVGNRIHRLAGFPARRPTAPCPAGQVRVAALQSAFRRSVATLPSSRRCGGRLRPAIAVI